MQHESNVDLDLIFSKPITTNEKVALLAIMLDNCISIRKLAEKMCVSKGTATKVVKSLESKGIISHEQRQSKDGGLDSNKYTILKRGEI